MSAMLLDLTNTSSFKASTGLGYPTEDLDGVRICADHQCSVLFDHQSKEHPTRPEVVDIVLVWIVLQREVTLESLLLLDVEVLLVLAVLDICLPMK